MTKAITIEKLIDCARGLKSDDGGNREYDRALIELVTEASGHGMDHRAFVAAVLGIEWSEGD